MRKTAIFLLFAAALAAQERRLRILVLTGEMDQYHDWRATTAAMRGILERSGRFEVKVAEQVAGLASASLASYDALLLNYNGPRWGDATERAVEEFIRSGKGLMAVHGVSYGVFFGQEFQGRWRASSKGDPGWTAYPEMLGASWKPENIGHGARHVFPVKWVDREHPIARGLAPAFTANDELYHRLDLRPNARVLAAAFSAPETGGTGRDEPMMWAVPFGKGRVAYCTLGHDTSAMAQPGFAAALARGAEWVATGAVTLPAHVSPLPETRQDAMRVLVVTGGHGYPASFYTLFEGYADIRWSHAATQQQAFNARLKDYDALVLHDMYNDMGETERAHLRAYMESGKGVVQIHHAIVNYTAWPWWWREVIGGKYFEKPLGEHAASKYREGVDFTAVPARGAARHPVMAGVPPLPIHDEVYKGMWLSPKITVLMETDHPENDRPVVYTGPDPKLRAVYIQPGHGDSTMRHPGYRRLVYNAVRWAARRE
jgi:type 1 glutamine amidotransferase